MLTLVTFMVAGFDTTSSVLSTLLYVLATYPNELEKLKKEIDTVVKIIKTYNYIFYLFLITVMFRSIIFFGN